MTQAATQIIDFESPEFIPELCGPNHSHLAIIEQAFDVYIEAPGNQIVIAGSDLVNREQAAEVIHLAYKRLQKGYPLGAGGIADLVREVSKGQTSASKPKTGKAGDKKGPALDSSVIPVPRRKPIIPKTLNQQAFIKSIEKNTLVFGVGPAGTGKTFLATAYGASLLARGEVSRFIACRPAVEAGENLGFLPGDMAEKVDPYLQPIWDALNQVLGREEVERRREAGDIEVAPLAFMRGRTLSDAFVVIDEAQNATISQMKMVLTRLGERAKYAVTGDPTQSDLPRTAKSGLAHALSILEGIPDIDIIRYTNEDVVRHPLVGKIVKAYEDDSRQLHTPPV